MPQPLTALIQEVASLLQRTDRRVVFAESCTGGLVAASLARVPGISRFLCGSAVVYRLDTKAQWLGVPESLLINPGPVSGEVAAAMAEGVLARTPEADIAVSITGHLGPDAPKNLDGVLYIARAVRKQDLTQKRQAIKDQERQEMPSLACLLIGQSMVMRHRLPPETVDDPEVYPGNTHRENRQWAAVELVLASLFDALT